MYKVLPDLHDLKLGLAASPASSGPVWAWILLPDELCGTGEHQAFDLQRF